MAAPTPRGLPQLSADQTYALVTDYNRLGVTTDAALTAVEAGAMAYADTVGVEARDYADAGTSAATRIALSSVDIAEFAKATVGQAVNDSTTALAAALQAQQDAADALAYQAEGVEAADAQVAGYVDAESSATSRAIRDAARSAVPAERDLTPMWIDTMPLVGTWQAAPGARTGLAATTTPTGGFAAENTATGVSGTAGQSTLTTSDPMLATLHGSGAHVWDAVVEDAHGSPVVVTVVAVSGTTATVLHPLPRSITDGTLTSRVASPGDQHITLAGNRALAHHVATYPATVATRGGLTDGQWKTLPPQHRAPWTPNAALSSATGTATGGVTAGVRPMGTRWSVGDSASVIFRPSKESSGTEAGMTATGQAVAATLTTLGRDAVVQVQTGASAGGICDPTTRLHVVVTDSSGATLYAKHVGPGLYTHTTHVVRADSVTVTVALVAGPPANVLLGELTVRESGKGTTLRPRKALLLGDSWTSYYNGHLGKELADALDCEVATYGKGGMTTDWGLAHLDRAIRENPGVDTIIAHFYTNDLNNNQNYTGTGPDGEPIDLWPSGLTEQEARDRWARQISILAAAIQQRGVRPVIIGPGGVSGARQTDASVHFERPHLIQWRPAPGEMDDPASYLNTVGKTTGTTVTAGTSPRVATGPAPTDPWVNDAEDGLLAFHASTLSKATYTVASVGPNMVDANGNGWADGLFPLEYGVATYDTFTWAVQNGEQVVTSQWGAGSTGGQRVGMYVPTQPGVEYLVIYRVKNATKGRDLNDCWHSISGSAFHFTAPVAADGTATIAVRATASAARNAMFGVAAARRDGESHTLTVTEARAINLTRLIADVPLLAGRSTTELAEFTGRMGA